MKITAIGTNASGIINCYKGTFQRENRDTLGKRVASISVDDCFGVKQKTFIDCTGLTRSARCRAGQIPKSDRINFLPS